MKFISSGVIFAVIILIQQSNCSPTNVTETTTKHEDHVLDHSYAEDILQSFEKKLNEWLMKTRTGDWNYETNLTDGNLKDKLQALAEASEYQKQVRKQINQLKWKDLQDENIKRQFCKLTYMGPRILPEESFKEVEQILSRAERLLNTMTICDYKDPKKCNLTLVPDVTGIMANSRDPEELKHVWTKWHDACGQTMMPNFLKYVQLLTNAAKLYNWTDYTVGFLKNYEADNFTDQIEALWQDVKPFYQQLHAHVRRSLKKQYGDGVVSKDGLIPMHLVGDMWSQKWSNIGNFTAPFPNKKPIDVTEEMIKQGYDVKKMYRIAEDNFISMGLPKLPESFWEKSIFTKPTDRDIVCESPPWDFNDGKDFRVNKCHNVSMSDLRIAHRLVGDIQYFMQYKDQRYVFKMAANPGFREAIGDLVSLSAMTPMNLAKVGVLSANATDPEIEMNNLYYTALERVANLPYLYVTEKWRWDVFQNKISADKYNCLWWKLTEEIQGIKSPIERSKENFDAGTEYSIAVDYPNLRYLVGTILQFQLHKHLCMEIGEFKPNDPNSKPLHLCDITKNTLAGDKLKSGMKLGSSKPWQDVLEKITGQRQMDASGLLDYFKPLHEWLKNENTKNNEHVGWTNKNKDCATSTSFYG